MLSVAVVYRTMTIRAFRWALLCALFGLMWGSGYTQAQDDKTVPQTVVLANGEWSPYLSKNLPYYGVASRIVSAAFATQGVRVKYVFLPWKRAFYMAGKGEFDGTLAWRDSPSREKLFRMSDPVFMGKTVFFHTRQHRYPWSTLDDLKGLRVGETLGYIYNHLAAAEQRGLIHTERAPTDRLNFLKLAHGRIDLFPCDLTVGLWLLNTKVPPEEAAQITWSPQPLEVVGYHVLLTRTSSRSRMLLQKLNRGLAQLRREGVVQQWLKEASAPLSLTDSLRSISSAPPQSGG